MKKDTSSMTRSVIMELVKSKFQSLPLWQTMENEIALLCAKIPEPVDDEKRLVLIEKLREIKFAILDKGIVPEEVAFIDEEIERYNNTNQMSLYEEADDYLEQSIIDKYATLSPDTEGIVGIHLPLNYVQLGKLTDGVYARSGVIKFYISRDKTVYGKLTASIYELPQNIPVATLIESIKKDRGTGEPEEKKVVLFGTKIPSRLYKIVKQIEAPFYVYRFITEDSQELILLSTEKHEIGDYIITGVMTRCDDLKVLTESTRLPTKLPFMFAQIVRNRIIKYKTHDELMNRVAALGITKDNFFEYPFALKVKNKKLILVHPIWFKQLIWAWLTHAGIGLNNEYPLHILMLGPPGSGKSKMLTALNDISKEHNEVCSGSGSTVKALVPSFREIPPRIGYLAESNRFALLDEFLMFMINARTTSESTVRDESVAMMNDLLEHQKREMGSGNSKITVNMTARVLAVSNPVRGVINIEDLTKLYSKPFLSRWFIYHQSESHVKLIQNSKNEELKTFETNVTVNDWIGIIDYLHSFQSTYDKTRLDEMYSEVLKLLPEDLKNLYLARYRHHIECITDGVIKTRCLLEGDRTFSAKDEDYNMVKLIWSNVIKTWVNPDMIRQMPVKNRIYYLPEMCQFIYWKIEELMEPVYLTDIKNMLEKHVKPSEFIEASMILIDMGVLIEESPGIVKPYFMQNHIEDNRPGD